MVDYSKQVERLQACHIVEAELRTRRDILKPETQGKYVARRLLSLLDPGIDYEPTPGAADRVPLPFGLRTARYSLSPLLEPLIGSDGCVHGMKLFRMPRTLDEMVEFIARGCPVAEEDWDELRRIIYLAPDDLAVMLMRIKEESEVAARLILSREYRIAATKFPSLLQPIANDRGYKGPAMDMFTAYGELERCDSLGHGLAVFGVTAKAVRHALADQTRTLEAIEAHSRVGEFLLNRFLDPQLMFTAWRSGHRYGPWRAQHPLAYDPIADLSDKNRFQAFRDDVLSLSPFVAMGDRQRVSGHSLATYWSLDLPRLADVTFIAAGQRIKMLRNNGTHAGVLRGPREEALRILADGFAARHDPDFKTSLAAKRAEATYKWVAADIDARSLCDEGSAAIKAQKTTSIGASRQQRARDGGQLMAPTPHMPGHSCAIDGAIWLSPNPDRSLWRALCGQVPARDWLMRRSIDQAGVRAFEEMRKVRKSAPTLFRGGPAKQHARLLAALATATGGLSGNALATERVSFLLTHAHLLRMEEWLSFNIGRRFRGGGDVGGRKKRDARRSLPAPTQPVRTS